MSRNLVITGLIILLILAAGIFFYAKSKSGIESSDMNNPDAITISPSPIMTPEESASASASMSPEASASGQMTVKSFTVVASNFKFTPSTITVKKGDTVKITFQNSGGSHDFVIDEFKIHSKIIPSGASETVQFVADKSGSFFYYCSVANHRQMGMQGTLIVQ